MFIRVERTSKWDEHLETLRKMLNLFGPTGRINYAKSSRLYLQSMQNIQSNHQWPLDQCCKSSFHCLPRTNRFWVGLLPDLVIEQCMVWALKKKKVAWQKVGYGQKYTRSVSRNHTRVRLRTCCNAWNCKSVGSEGSLDRQETHLISMMWQHNFVNTTSLTAKIQGFDAFSQE